MAKVRRQPGGVELLTAAGPATFDHLVMATHSDQALALLGDPSSEERHVLGALRYQPNRATLHTDATLLPANRRAWASWNYVHPDGPAQRATLTYYLNRLQGFQADQPVLVTLNRDEAIDPDKVVARFDYAHPIVDEAAVAAHGHQLPLSAGHGLLLRRLLGLRVPRGRRPQRRGRLPALRGAAVSAVSPAALRSALYEGTVTHRRAEPVHRFTNRVALPLLFLDEMAELRAVHPLVDLDPSPHRRRRPAAMRFHRDDYLPSDAPTVQEAVEETVTRAGGSVRGPVAMLGHVRTWGWLFNPLTLYYCFDPSGLFVEWTVLEVSNTPWHERCRYVVGAPGNTALPRPCTSRRSFRRRAPTRCATPRRQKGSGSASTSRRPGRPRRIVGGTNHRAPNDQYRSSRSRWCCGAGGSTAPHWPASCGRHPLMTARVSGGIYAQALRLGARQAPFHPHPHPGRGGRVGACPSMPTVPASALESAHD